MSQADTETPPEQETVPVQEEQTRVDTRKSIAFIATTGMITTLLATILYAGKILPKGPSNGHSP